GRQSAEDPQPGVLAGDEARAVEAQAQFDEPFADCIARGAEVRIEGRLDAATVRLHVREAAGREIISTVDPRSYVELSRRTREADGAWNELHFRDYHKAGALNLAWIQEQRSGGSVDRVTRITQAAAEPGLLAGFFWIPSGRGSNYLDFMNAVALVSERSSAMSTVNPASSP